MPRITVNVDEETKERLERERERLNWSLADAGGFCIEAHLSAVDRINPQQTDVGDHSNVMQADSDRLDDLEQRVEKLEESAAHRAERLSALESRDAGHDTSTEAAAPADDDSLSRTPESHSGPVSGSEGPPDAGGVAEPDTDGDSLRAAAVDAINGVDIPGRSEATREARAEALLWAWEFLRNQERAQSSQIANATYDAFDEETIGYSAQEKYRGRGLWQGFLREALRELPRVDGPGARGRTWEFRED